MRHIIQESFTEYEFLSDLLINGKSLIGDEWINGESIPMIALDPLTGMTYWSGNAISEDQANKAITSAVNGFKDWSLTDLVYRESICRRFAELLKNNSDKLSKLIHLETGKPQWECVTEVTSMAGKIALSINAYHQRSGLCEKKQGEVQTQLAHRPHGALVVLGPYNFPGHLPNGHIVPALLAGNTIVFKPSEYTPAVAEYMTRLWCQAGLPTGVLNLVQGDFRLGEVLSNSPQISGLLFTGSSSTGAKLHQSFAHSPDKMLALEMGGNNPLIVSSVKDVKSAVYTILQSAFISAGQRCTCARRLILVDNSINRKLMTQLISSTRNLKVGGENDCFLGPVISRDAGHKLMDFQSVLDQRGAQALVSCNFLDDCSALINPGIWDVSGVDDIPDEECFGPLLQVLWVGDLEEATVIANRTRYGLSSGLLSDEKSDWDYFLPRAQAGIVNWNRPLTGASGSAPFGGVGASGNGRPSAFYAADYCAYPVASMMSERIELPNTLLPGVSL